MSSVLLLVYDAEDPGSRRLVDRVGRRDRDGLVVSFPYLNGELVRVAPELAGMEFPGEVFTLDSETREVHGGAGILPGLLARLPFWTWAQVPARIPLFARLLFNWLRR